MKKIHIYTQYYFPVANACSNRAEKYVRAFSQDYDITIVTWMPNYPTWIKSKPYKYKLWRKEQWKYQEKIIRTYELAVKNSGSFLRTLNYISFLFSSLIYGLFSKKPDKIIVTSPPLFTAISVFCISKIRKIPYILEVRDLWPDSVVALWYMKEKSISFKVFSYLEKKIYLNAETIVWVTQWICDEIEKKWIEKKKIVLQYNLSDIINQNWVSESPYEKYQEKINGRKISLFAGNMNEAYDFIEAAKLISERQDIFFVFIGDGSMKHLLVSKTKWLDNIIFLERVSSDEIKSYIFYSDICFIPLKNEEFYNMTFPVKWIEAIVNKKDIIFLGPPKWEFANFLNKFRMKEISEELFLLTNFKINLKKYL